MADKEATVFIVDVGRSMAKSRNGRTISDLDYSLQFTWDKLTNIVFLGRKTVLVGVIGLGTEETQHGLKDGEGYEHLSELLQLESIGMSQLRSLSLRLVPNDASGDAMSAIVLAVDTIGKKCGKLKYKKQIILVTNGRTPMEADSEDIDSIAEQMKSMGIHLTVLGVDFDDAEYGFREENKPSAKKKNEELLGQLVAKAEGVIGTMREAIEGLAIPFIKPVRPTPTYRGQLTLGDPEHYDTAISIDVERYFKVASKRPPAASSFVMKTSHTADDSLQTVEYSRTYRVRDPKNPDGMIDIDRDELAKGYEYGRTAVHIAESDENVTKLETSLSYSILGFVPKDNVERYMMLYNTNIIVASKASDKAALALNSLVRALYINDSCAVGRLVKKDMSEPQLTLLSPHVTDEIECLVENALPFAEDVRQYRFPQLDKIWTVSGQALSSHRNLPSKDLLSAMDDFVDKLSLVGDEERLSIEETFSPVNFSIESAIKYRAVHPDKAIPRVPDTILAPSKPPADIQDRSANAVERLVKAADVKKVPPKVKGRARYREREKPLSGLNVDDLFRTERPSVQISPANAISEFKQAFDNAASDKALNDAMEQMSAIVRNRIKDSFGDKNYDRVTEELGTMRVYAGDYEKSDLYNDVIRALKKDILSGKLGGDRREMWWKIRKARLGLIHREEPDQETSGVTRQEAEEFLIPR